MHLFFHEMHILILMDERDTKAITMWEEVRSIVTSADIDLRKNAEGNRSAGKRLRKQLRTLQKLLQDLVRRTVAVDKGRV